MSNQLDPHQTGLEHTYTQWHNALTVSHAFTTQIRLCVSYQSDSWNEHALRPLQTQCDTRLSLLNACWDNFLQALLICLLPPISLRPSIFISFSLRVLYLPVYLSSPSEVWIQIESSFPLVFCFYSEHLSSFLAVSFPLLKRCHAPLWLFWYVQECTRQPVCDGTNMSFDVPCGNWHVCVSTLCCVCFVLTWTDC